MYIWVIPLTKEDLDKIGASAERKEGHNKKNLSSGSPNQVNWIMVFKKYTEDVSRSTRHHRCKTVETEEQLAAKNISKMEDLLK